MGERSGELHLAEFRKHIDAIAWETGVLRKVGWRALSRASGKALSGAMRLCRRGWDGRRR